MEGTLSLTCNECSAGKKREEAWWCRDCGRTLCSTCNLVKKHTEHRSAPWDLNDLYRSCLLAFESRCSKRSREAAQEESDVKEFIENVKARLTAKIARQLENENESDRRKIAILGRMIGTYRFQPGPRTVSDADIQRMVAEVGKVNPSLAESLQEKSHEPVTLVSKRSFAVFPDDLSADDFTSILENQLVLRSRPGTAASDRAESHNSSFGTSPRLGSGEIPGPIGANGRHDASTSTPLETTNGDVRLRFPLEPKVNISTDPLPSPIRNGYGRKEGNGKQWSPVGERTNLGSERSTGYSSFEGPDSRASSRMEKSSLAMDSFSMHGELNGSGRDHSDSLLIHEDPSLRRSSAVDDGRTPTPSRGLEDGVNGSSTRYHFGTNYLTRPIDVCVLGNNRLAISDSCGGVYITKNKDGDVERVIPTEGASASSLAYSQSQSRLYVSLLRKRGRSIGVYDGAALELVGEIACPDSPKIDQSRTRWIATDMVGEIYLCSGDNAVSAIWKYDWIVKKWRVIVEEKKARFQYLQVAEENEERRYVVLMTNEGLTGNVLLFVVGPRVSPRENEYNLTHTYHLRDYIHSPASSVCDSKGNLLILDYTSGKLWLLGSTDSSSGTRTKQMKNLADLGPHQALGMTVENGWCFVACMGMKRVEAIMYDEKAEVRG